MNTYLRLLSFARPLGKRVPKYIIYTLLSIVFSLATLALVGPLLEVLFDRIEADEIAKYSQRPQGSFTLDYVKEWFYYYLIYWKTQLGSFTTLIYVSVVILVSSLFSNLFKYLSNVELAYIRTNSVTKLRKTIFDKVSRLHIGYFTNERKGDIMSRITNDVQQVEVSIVNSLTVIFREPATIIVYFIFLFTYSVKLTLFTIVVLPISGWLISGIAKRLKKKATESQESLGRIVNILDETLGGMRVIKAFTARSFVAKKFGDEVDLYGNVNIHMAKRNELASPISEFLGVFFVAGIRRHLAACDQRLPPVDSGDAQPPVGRDTARGAGHASDHHRATAQRVAPFELGQERRQP